MGEVSQCSKTDKSCQNVGLGEVEGEMKRLSLRKGDKKSNVSVKHVTYKEDIVVSKRTEEKVEEKEEPSETVEEKKAKRRKMIENAKRRKAEAEARIEPEKAAEGSQKRQQGGLQGAPTLS